MRSFGSVIISGVIISSVAVALLALGMQPAAAQPTAPEELYAEAQSRETALRAELATAGRDRRQSVPASGTHVDRCLSGHRPHLFFGEIADDALWQGAGLSDELFQRFGDALDRDTAVRLLQQLAKRFPASPFSPQTRARIARLSAAPAKSASAAAAAAPPVTPPVGTPARVAVDRAAATASPTPTPTPGTTSAAPVRPVCRRRTGRASRSYQRPPRQQRYRLRRR